MRQSVIMDIFHGKKGTFDSIEVPKEILDGMKRNCTIERQITERLYSEVLKLFQKYLEGQGDTLLENIELYFLEGFRLGLQIGIEGSQTKEIMV